MMLAACLLRRHIAVSMHPDVVLQQQDGRWDSSVELCCGQHLIARLFGSSSAVHLA
jgi:hypothetical protein